MNNSLTWIDFDKKDYLNCIITTFDDGYQTYEYKYPNK